MQTDCSILNTSVDCLAVGLYPSTVVCVGTESKRRLVGRAQCWAGTKGALLKNLSSLSLSLFLSPFLSEILFQTTRVYFYCLAR